MDIFCDFCYSWGIHICESDMHAIYEDRSYAGGLPVVAYETRNMKFPAHWHADVELVCVCNGSLLVGINNEPRILHKGDIAICSSGDIHYYDCKSGESVHRMIIFRPELVDNAGGWPRGFSFSKPFAPAERSEELYQSFNAAYTTIRSEIMRTDLAATMLIRSSLLGLCGTLTRAMPTEAASVVKATHRHHRLKAMQDALSFIESNFMESITLKDAAEVANMSVCHFSRLFGTIAGDSFKGYLNQLRVNKAEELIKASEESITDIAYQCGYGSVRSFNRAFLSARGLTPSEFRG